jgi:hypothetical protein
MSASRYDGIRFTYDDMISDVRQMTELAKKFLQAGSIGVLESLIVNIENIRNATPNVKHRLSVALDRGIATIASTSYRDSPKGRKNSVYGLLSFHWEIMNWDKGRKRRQDSFDLVGVASTSIKVLTENNELVAHWQFEAGDHTSPGCHFHSSINQGGAEGLFPEWLKIPRLPGLLLTPMDGLDFLLGELFQSDWVELISKDSQHRNGWAKSQTNRLLKLLNWQETQVKGNRIGTPWMSLKKAKPPIDIFYGK